MIGGFLLYVVKRLDFAIGGWVCYLVLKQRVLINIHCCRMSNTILEYYNQLASKYDQDRFANSYGDYLHQQEVNVIEKYLSPFNIENNLDVACGTGRFLNYARHGVDFSPEMIEIARGKFREKKLLVADAKSLPYPEERFINVTAFHLFMHLTREDLHQILNEVARITKKGGKFIFDIPSEKRRNLTKYKAPSWHGGFQISVNGLEEIAQDQWNLKAYNGIGFFPIHKIPKSLRKLARPLDTFFAKSPLREYSSHLIYVLTKK